MLAELVAANTAFAIIKKTITNTGEIAKAGKAISDFVIAMKKNSNAKGRRKRSQA